MKHSTIFRSRWAALLWAAGFVWFAVDVATPPTDKSATHALAATDAAQTDALGQPIDPQQVEALANQAIMVD